MNIDENHCPICTTEAMVNLRDHAERLYVNCRNCGPFTITRAALSEVQSDRARAIISHTAYKMEHGVSDQEFDRNFVERLLKSAEVPDHATQANNFVRYLGQRLKAEGRFGGTVSNPPECFRAPIGVFAHQDFQFIANELEKAGLVHRSVKTGSSRNGTRTVWELGLTFDGWNRFEEIERTASDSRIAFMAMEYGDPAVDEMYKDCFLPAVAQTGFRLKRLDENPKAGIIDNHLRVEIRNARFLLAELSHANKGSYWEAGFAEGLEKPVIFLCEKSVFQHEDNKKRPHFDTNHSQTIVWEREKPKEAQQAIKDTIRATLPGEAKMTDE